MNCARVGVYSLSTDATEATRLATKEMLPIFKRQPGFVDYQVVSTNDALISISTWKTREQADEGTRQAAKFVESHPGMMKLEQHFVGDATRFSLS
jgi:heme-degrading monooxygenase HmoA